MEEEIAGCTTALEARSPGCGIELRVTCSSPNKALLMSISSAPNSSITFMATIYGKSSSPYLVALS